ncbi:hypothetical protein [Microbulbifer discodermiae]|uniref:hypothetical protein n=1 Tax=Microbulbifer sp. 2201CG32-9 TaxID=3232309 RepID=UPI00345B6261
MKQLSIIAIIGCFVAPAMAKLVDDAKDQCIDQDYSWRSGSKITNFYSALNRGAGRDNKTIYFGTVDGAVYQVKIPTDIAEAIIVTTMISNLRSAYSLENILDLCVDENTSPSTLLGIHSHTP